MMRIAVSAALLALAASCGGGGGGPGTGGTGGGATAGTGGASTGGGGGTSGGGPGGTGGAAPRCGNPSAVVSCTLATGDVCQEALVNDTSSAVRFFCTGGATLTEGTACPRNAQLAGCCSDPAMRLANCYYSPSEAQTGRTACAQAGNVWCDP